MDLKVPQKIRLSHSTDSSSDPLQRAANAIAQVFPRLRIALAHLGGMPEEALDGLEQDIDLLHAVAVYDECPDLSLIAAIDRIYAQLSCADLSDEDAAAWEFAHAELSAARASWQSISDRLEAERIIYQTLLGRR